MKRLLLLLLVFTLSACSSKQEKKTPPLMSQNMAGRLTKPDMNRRSVYDKSMQASLNPKSNSGAWFGKQKHNAKAFTGTKAFTQTPDFKTSTYSRATAQSAMGRQSFAEASKTPADADTQFATSTSRFSTQTARESSQTFAGANDVFKTGAQRDAARSQRKNVRPEFIQLEEYSRDPAYSEDQVRRLMGRD